MVLVRFNDTKRGGEVCREMRRATTIRAEDFVTHLHSCKFCRDNVEELLGLYVRGS